MDAVTFQWVAGIAFSIVTLFAGWIFKFLTDKLSELKKENEVLREQLQSVKDYEKAENDKLRESFDKKVAELHTRINNESKEIGMRLTEQAKEHANLKVTVTGFQGAFMTREEHQRFCNALQTRRQGGGA